MVWKISHAIHVYLIILDYLLNEEDGMDESTGQNFSFSTLKIASRKIVFCYQNCSSDQENLLKFEAEGRELAKFLRSLEQFTQTVKGLNKFW